MEKLFETKFSFAGKTIKIKTNNKKLSKTITVYYPEFSSEKKEDLTLTYLFYEGNQEFNLYIMKDAWRSDEKISEKKNDFFVFKHKKGKNTKLISGFLDLKKKQGKFKITTDKNFFWGFFVFNMAKCLAVYLNDIKGNVIHSSAIAEKNHGFLFSGKSKSGKTTVIRTCPETTTLGDDLNFIFKKGTKFFVQMFPLIAMVSNINRQKAKAFELKAVLFLKKSKKIKLKKLKKPQAINKMLENDIQGTFNFQKIKTKERILLYNEMLSGIPVFILYFPLEKNLWKKLKPELKKAVNLK